MNEAQEQLAELIAKANEMGWNVVMLPVEHAHTLLDPIEDEYRSVEEAAQYLCIQPSTLNKYRSLRKGPAFRKHGDRVVYSIQALNRWSRLQ